MVSQILWNLEWGEFLDAPPASRARYSPTSQNKLLLLPASDSCDPSLVLERWLLIQHHQQLQAMEKWPDALSCILVPVTQYIQQYQLRPSTEHTATIRRVVYSAFLLMDALGIFQNMYIIHNSLDIFLYNKWSHFVDPMDVRFPSIPWLEEVPWLYVNRHIGNCD